LGRGEREEERGGERALSHGIYIYGLIYGVNHLKVMETI